MIPENPSRCSYSGDPSTSLRDQVRFWCQDTDKDFWILTDWEYDYLIEYNIANTNDHPVWIASIACTVIASKFSREVTVSSDGVSVDVGSLQRKYLDLASSLRESYDEEHGNMDLPTLSHPLGDHEYDPDVPALLFGIGMSDNFQAGIQDYGWRRLYTPRDTTVTEETL